MLPGNGIGDTDKTCYPGSPEYKFKYGSEGLNTSEIKEYIRNPHKFNIKREMDGRYINLWSTDNDKTDGNDEVVIKSVYDPSPVGYSLPASNAFTGFTTTGQNAGSRWYQQPTPEEFALFNVEGPFNKGYYFYTKPNNQGQTFFFPASGDRALETGNLCFVNQGGWGYVSGVLSNNSSRSWGFSPGTVAVLGSNTKNHGWTVRSAEERKS